MQLFLTDPIAATIAAAVIGLCIGSFLNVVIHRLPKMLERDWQAQCAELAGAPAPPDSAYNLWRPASACPACGHRIGALENIPVVSWLLLRGKCRACAKAISPRYPVVEIAGGVLAAVAIWHFGATAKGAAAALLLWTLLALAMIDADTMLLPDNLTLPLLWGGLVANLFGVFVPLADAVMGAIAGYLALWAVYWLFRLVFRKEGMGYGDFKLLAALGAWLGWKMLLPIIVLSSVAGAAIGIVLIAFQGRDKAKPLPFGPYLAAGGAIALFAGPKILETWLH